MLRLSEQFRTVTIENGCNLEQLRSKKGNLGAIDDSHFLMRTMLELPDLNHLQELKIYFQESILVGVSLPNPMLWNATVVFVVAVKAHERPFISPPSALACRPLGTSFTLMHMYW